MFPLITVENLKFTKFGQGPKMANYRNAPAVYRGYTHRVVAWRGEQLEGFRLFLWTVDASGKLREFTLCGVAFLHAINGRDVRSAMSGDAQLRPDTCTFESIKFSMKAIMVTSQFMLLFTVAWNAWYGYLSACFISEITRQILIDFDSLH
jgi:hypothetical protein